MRESPRRAARPARCSSGWRRWPGAATPRSGLSSGPPCTPRRWSRSAARGGRPLPARPETWPGARSALARFARLRGRLEAARGNRQEAEAALGRSIETFRELAMPYELALGELALGQVLRRTRRRRAAV